MHNKCTWHWKRPSQYEIKCACATTMQPVLISPPHSLSHSPSFYLSHFFPHLRLSNYYTLSYSSYGRVVVLSLHQLLVTRVPISIKISITFLINFTKWWSDGLEYSCRVVRVTTTILVSCEVVISGPIQAAYEVNVSSWWDSYGVEGKSPRHRTLKQTSNHWKWTWKEPRPWSP